MCAERVSENRFAVRLDHVAIGVRSIAETTAFLVGALGARTYEKGPGGGFRFAQWEFDGGGRLELIEPVGPADGFLHRFLDRRGPSVHHVTFKVPDLRAAADRAEEIGYTIVGYDDSYPGWKECFLHPKQAQGIVVQMAESSPGLDVEIPFDWDWPPLPADPPAPVRLVGVRIAARDEATAHRQWGTLLGGELQRSDGSLEYRWPESPLRIRVDLDPKREPGPRWLEIQAARRVEMPTDVERIFGTPFRNIAHP